MANNELYEKVRTAKIGTVLEHNGKVGVVVADDGINGPCNGCVYRKKPYQCDAASTVDKSLAGLSRLPCVSWRHESGNSVIVRETEANRV